MKTKVKCPTHWLAIVCIIVTLFTTVISVFCTIMLFVDDKAVAAYEENYKTADDVRNSKGYKCAMAVLTDIDKSSSIDKINEIRWMYIQSSEGMLFKITYTTNNEIKTTHYLAGIALEPHYHPLYGWRQKIVLDIKPIDKFIYNFSRNDWLDIENDEQAYWAKEKSYSDFALNVINNDFIEVKNGTYNM